VTVAQAFPLQVAVADLVTAAVPGVEVYDHAPNEPQGEYLRLDGFGLRDRSAKNKERARHAFEVHYFHPRAAATDSQGQGRVKDVLALVHEVIKGATFAGSGFRFETMDVDSDTDATSVHGWLRYSITI